MKILHICAVGFTVKHFLRPQINYFIDQGLSVEVACSPGQEVEELKQQGYTIYPVKIDRKIDPISNLKSIYKLAKIIQQNQYDLVHVHTPIASVLGRMAAKLAGTKRIMYTAHGFFFHDRSSSRQYQFYFTVEKVSALITDLLLTQSYEDFLTAQESGLCSKEKVRYLGNGVDIDYFKRDRLNSSQQAKLRTSLSIPDTANLIVGTVGRLTREKGSEHLIEAAAQLLPKFPNLCILVIGGQLSSDPEPFQTQLLEKIHQLGIEKNVILTGYREDIPEILGLLDIFTLPSFREGLPRSILEAMAMELPVVATDIRGCREAVVDSKTGFIVPPKDSDKLAKAFQVLLSNKEMRESFGASGRQRVEAEYDEHLVFSRLAQCYRDLGVL